LNVTDIAMENTHAIIWVAKHKETSGLGTKRFSREEAENLAAELNDSHPGFIHRAFDTATEDQRQVAAALKAGANPAAASVSYPDFAADQAAKVQAPVILPAPEEKIIALEIPSVRPAAGE